MTAEFFIQAITPLLKSQGFKKSSATWRRTQAESIAVLNIQKSSWGGGIYYVNVGVYFSALGALAAPTENQCHVGRRLDVEDPLLVVEKAMTWFGARSRFCEAARLADTDAKNGLVVKEVRNASREAAGDPLS